MTSNKTSGIEKAPRILRDPFYTDPFFWCGVFCATFWLLIAWWLFF